MKAAVYHGPLDVRVEDVAEPRAPVDGEVLLEVTRAAICGTDAAEYASGPHLIPPNRSVILGHEFTGTIVAVGSNVDDLHLGLRVVPGAGMWCGACEACVAGRTNLCRRYYTLGLQVDGGLAEFALVPSVMCVPVPESCSDEAAAMGQPLAVALHAVRRGRIEPGESVLVLGVGGIGAFIVAAAKARGATPVIAADIRTERLETARKLGADAVVDVRSTDLATSVRDLTGGLGPAVVVEATGQDGATATAAACARRGGRVVVLGLPPKPQLLELSRLTLGEIDLIATVAHVCKVDLPEALSVLATSRLTEVVVDRVVPLSSVVEDGLEPLAAGALDGKVLVSLAA